MSRRRIIIVFQILSGLLVGAAILFAILAWRLSSSPVSLNFVTPFIERNFSAVDKSYVVRVEDTVLIWDGWRRPADIRARNIKIFSRDGKLLVRLPQVSIGLSMRAVLRGRLAVASLGIRRLRASVARFPDGSFTVGLLAQEGPEQNVAGLLQGAASELSHSFGESDGPLGYLKRVEITESQLTFDDRQAGIVWRSPRADIVMSRESAGLKTDAAIVIQAQNRQTNFFAQLDYRRQSGEFLARTRFENLNPSLLARSVAGLGDLVNFNMPVTGEVAIRATKDGVLRKMGGGILAPIGRVEGEFEFSAGGKAVVGLARFEGLNVSELAKRIPRLRNLAGLQVNFNGSIGGKGQLDGGVTELEFNLVSGAGTMDVPEMWPSPREVRQIRFKGSVMNDFDEIDLAEAIVDFGGPKIEADARVERIGGEARLQLNATLFDMPFKTLEAYWPKQLAKTARRWVTTNIRRGHARETNLRLIGWMPAGEFGGFNASSVNGTMRYDGLEVDYWSPLPKIRRAGGTATFNARRFDMVISSGDLQDIKIDQAQVNMFALDTNDEQISVDILMRGPLKTALQVLDHKPLHYIRKLGLSANDVAGQSAIRLRMDFPLDTNVDRDQLRVRSSATLKQVAFSPGPFGLDIRNGRFEFKMIDDEMSVRGPVKLNNVETRLVWREHFSDKRKIKSEYRLRAELGTEDRKALGLTVADFIDGPAGVNMTYSVLRNGARHLVANLDLSKAAFEQSEVGISKIAGERAGANIQATFDRQGAMKSVRAKLAGDGISGAAELQMKPDPAHQWRAVFKKIAVKGAKVDGTVARQDDGVYTSDLTLSRFDIENLMAKAGKSDEPRTEKESAALNLRAKIGALSWGAKRKLTDAELVFRFDNDHVQAMRLTGGIGGGYGLSIDFQPALNSYELRVETDDFGAALKALDIAENVTGGKLKLVGKRSSLTTPMEGSFTVGKYRLRKVPGFARIFQVASLTGIVDAFDRDGLEFETLEGRYAYNSGLLRLDKTRTYGSSIGITTEGTMNLNDDTANLGGAVIPAYTVNRILGQIPLLGRILTGGDNEGMFAATYSVKGALADPDVSVNPLSAFAPGLLRKFLGVFDGETGDPAAPEISKPDEKPVSDPAKGSSPP